MRQLTRVTVTMRELDRLKSIQAVVAGELKPIRAAERLGLTTRQVRRLAVLYRDLGPVGLVSRRRNQRSNHRLKSELEDQEDRAPMCTAIVYVDDATSRLMVVRFTGTESTFAYFEATREYLEHYGKPLAFYSDKASIFRVSSSAMNRENGAWQGHSRRRDAALCSDTNTNQLSAISPCIASITDVAPMRSR